MHEGANFKIEYNYLFTIRDEETNEKTKLVKLKIIRVGAPLQTAEAAYERASAEMALQRILTRKEGWWFSKICFDNG